MRLMIHTPKLSKLKSSFSVFLFALVLVTSTLQGSLVSAATNPADWRAGEIVDDGLFYNGNDMTAAQVQAFLNSEVPVCDTMGTLTSEYGGGTRAQYGTAHGHPPPYVCLRDYYENPTTSANNLNGNPTPAGAISAAQIIVNAAQTYGVSVRVLLATLQKESAGPLITDAWPYSTQYTNAMGYGCPDTAPCDARYAGFYNQVTNAAWQFMTYKNNPQNYRYKPLQNNSIQYSPNSACGASSVFLQNSATAGLYNYTPYQPDQAALNNLYGSGGTCSAYGNRNFWRIFKDWFGDTILDCGSTEPVLPQVIGVYNPTTYDHFYTSYNCEVNTVTMKQGYVSEGAQFNTTNPASVPTAVPVYRLYNPSTGQHLWTTSQDDINSAVSYAGYKVEGIGFYSAPIGAPGASIIWRLYNPTTYQHVWTGSQNSILLMTQKLGFRVEGIAFFSQ